jgi:hypothetical protein
MKKFKNLTKIITGVDKRWSCANVWDPKSINGRTPKYNVSLLIPKTDTVTINKVKAAIQAVYEESESKLKDNARACPPLDVIKNPLRDGDRERSEDETYRNCYFINANSPSTPGIVDANCQQIIERSEAYSSVYCRASINFYAFDSKSNRSIACDLNNLQKICDSEPLGGKSRAKDDFSSEDDDFLNYWKLNSTRKNIIKGIVKLMTNEILNSIITDSIRGTLFAVVLFLWGFGLISIWKWLINTAKRVLLVFFPNWAKKLQNKKDK